MVYIYGVHIWCTYMVYIYDVHIWCTYMVYIYDVHIWCTYMGVTVTVHNEIKNITIVMLLKCPDTFIYTHNCAVVFW